jgi:ribosome-binding factor A
MREGHLEETIRRRLADVVGREVRDPRVGFVTFSEVRLNRDNSVAWVFFTVMGDVEDRKRTLAGLRSCRSFLRQRLGESLRVRTIPELRFRYDDSLDRSFRVDRILEELDDDSVASGRDPEPDDSHDEGGPA